MTRPTHRSRHGRRRGRHTEPTVTADPRGDVQVTDRRAGLAAARRRHADAPQDTAMYSCECGFQFAASVSTSVACPHCGGAQAW